MTMDNNSVYTVENNDIDERYLKQFADIYNRLEPENLTCDGELSTSEWKRKEKKLLKDWKRLEKKVGRSVSEEEIEKVMYPDIYNAYSGLLIKESFNELELAEALAGTVMRGE